MKHIKKIIFSIIMIYTVLAMSADLVFASPIDTKATNKKYFTYAVNRNTGAATITGIKGNYPKKIVIPSIIDGHPVTKIGDNAFMNTQITTVSFPPTLQKIGKNAFAYCESLTGDLVFPEGLKEIGESAFCECKITGLSFPSTLKIIDDYAFCECESLTGDLIFRKGLRSIGYAAFMGCKNLMHVSFPSTLKRIEHFAFDECYNICGEITIPKGVTKIEARIFADSKKITKVKLPATLQSYSKTAFPTERTVFEYAGDISKIDSISRDLYLCDFELCKYHNKHYHSAGDAYILQALGSMNFDNAKTDLERIQIVHDWMVINLSYDGYWYGLYETGQSLRTADSTGLVHNPELPEWILSHRLAICSGYSELFKKFMDYLNIECIVVSSSAMNHCWNMVKMDDGHWYHVDVTWDDPGYENGWVSGWYSNINFLRNDDGIMVTGHNDWDDAPIADGDYYENEISHSVIYPIAGYCY